MHGVDDDEHGTVDRYRAAYDKADGAEEEQAEPFAEMAAWLFQEFLDLGRVAWAVAHPLRPLAPEILIEAGDAGTEALHEILPELRRFGQAILTQGNPSRLAELTGSGRGEREERELLHAAMKASASEHDLEIARRWARLFEIRLQVLGPEQRRDVLAEFHAALATK